jgi:hypothetical protein
MSLAATLRIKTRARARARGGMPQQSNHCESAGVCVALIDLEETLEKSAHVAGDILCHVCYVPGPAQQ